MPVYLGIQKLKVPSLEYFAALRGFLDPLHSATFTLMIKVKASHMMMIIRPVTRGGARGAFAPPHRSQRSAF